MSKIQDLIVEIVQDYGCIKGTELVTNLATRCHTLNIKDCRNLVEEIALAVRSHRIYELEYILQDSNYKIRSVYFPINTVFKESK